MRSALRHLAWSGGLLLSPLALSALDAQDAPRNAEIRGVVVRADTRQPVAGVTLSLEGTGITATTDKNGRFKFPKIAAGEYLVRAEVEGYPPTTSTVHLASRDRLEMEFQIGATDAQTLPEIEVSAATDRISPVIDFNRRAMEGNGRYITREMIERRRPANLMDLMKGIPGARIICPQTEHRCVLRLRRATCGPAYFLDGLPADPAVLFLTIPHDVEGIEVYSGPSETPIELEGVRSGCGVVAIWTRIGERPKKP